MLSLKPTGSHWRDRGSFSTEKVDDSWSLSQPARCPVRDSLRSQGDCYTYEPSRTDTPKVQHIFLERVDKLFQAILSRKRADLLSLDTNDIAHPSETELIFTHHDRGRTRFVEFMDGLESEVSTFYEPIKTFSDRNHAVWTLQSKTSYKITLSSFLSCSSHARVENATCMTSFVTRIIHSLLHWVMVGSSIHVRNPSLQLFLRVTLDSLIMNHMLMSSSLMVQH